MDCFSSTTWWMMHNANNKHTPVLQITKNNITKQMKIKPNNPKRVVVGGRKRMCEQNREQNDRDFKDTVFGSHNLTPQIRSEESRGRPLQFYPVPD